MVGISRDFFSAKEIDELSVVRLEDVRNIGRKTVKNNFGRNESIKTYLLILVPLVLGWLINSPIFGYYFPFLLSLVFLGFWFWVGIRFVKLEISKAYSLLIGNSLNIISLLLFIWSFYLVSDSDRNLYLAGFSQYYAIPTLSISAMVYHLTSPAVYTNEYVIISYVLMSVVFTVGFFYKLKR